MMKILMILALFISAASVKTQNFVKITDPSNPLVSDAGSLPGSYAGATWVDYDNDGLLDLFINRQNNSTFPLYRNLGNGNFQRVTPNPITFPGSSKGNSWADYNNDGNIDLYITGDSPRGSFLYKNNGNGTFSKIISGAIGDSVGNSGWACAWGDYNKDCYADLIITYPDGFLNPPIHPNRLFMNNGNGTFTRIDTSSVSGTIAQFTIPVWSDYDLDADLDLFIGSGPINFAAPDYLYKNNLTETSVPFFSRITTSPIATDSIDGQQWNWIDYDNDGDLDGFVTNWGLGIKNRLYKNNNGSYERMTPATAGDIVAEDGEFLANTWGDFDNDGDQDCFITLDGPEPGPPSRYYNNNGNGTFTRVLNTPIAANEGPNYGATNGDYDNDGDLDLYVSGTTNSKGLYRNDLVNGNTWINIKCKGSGLPSGSNSSGIGVKVWIKAVIYGNPVWQIREVSAQNSFDCHNMLNVHFGLGNAVVIDSLIIAWPGGIRDVYTNVFPGRFYTANEGQNIDPIGILQLNNTIPADFVIEQNYPNPFNPATKFRFSIPSFSDVNITIYDVTGKEVSVPLHGKLKPGIYEFNWNAGNLSSGVYFYSITSGEFKQTRKMVLLK